MTAARQLPSVKQAVPTIEFDDEDETTVQYIHPALDIVGDTLYVTVRASVGKKLQHLVLTSDGEIFTEETWLTMTQTRGLHVRTTVDISDLTERWNNKSLREFRDGTLKSPTWRDAYDTIFQAFDDHLVVIDRRFLVVLTLHAMMTYFHPLFDVLPILHLLGPSESGKSRAAVALGEVAFNGKVTGSATPATVFRKANAGRYTQIITEADELATQKSSDAFVKQLQGATTKGEAVVEVAEKGIRGPFQPRTFYAFNPRVLVSTKDFGKALTLRNRCIRLDMVKSPDADQEKLRKSITESSAWATGRDLMYRLLLQRWYDVEATRNVLRNEWVGENAPTGRTFDKWLPLATMANLAGDDVFTTLKELAWESMVEQQEDTTHSQMGILCHFMEYVVRNSNENLQRQQLWDELLKCSNRPGTYASHLGDSDVPDWARAYDDAITVGTLKSMFSGARKLVDALKRNRLIPQKPRPTNKCDVYEIKQADVLAMTRLYITAPDETSDARTKSNQPAPLRIADWQSGDDGLEGLPF